MALLLVRDIEQYVSGLLPILPPKREPNFVNVDCEKIHSQTSAEWELEKSRFYEMIWADGQGLRWVSTWLVEQTPKRAETPKPSSHQQVR